MPAGAFAPRRPRAAAAAALRGVGGDASAARGAAGTDLTTLSLESLMQLTVVGASKYEQKQSRRRRRERPHARRDQGFGWRALDEALASLPGVHTTYDRQYNYLSRHARLRPAGRLQHPRVLVTINGNRINDPGFDGGPMGASSRSTWTSSSASKSSPARSGAVYGQNAMFGVVNVVTRERRGPRQRRAGSGVSAPAGHARGAEATWSRKFGNGLDVLVSFGHALARRRTAS
ncbi:MAG: hypothetical protein U1F67_13125 [Rubrivivax sp.]